MRYVSEGSGCIDPDIDAASFLLKIDYRECRADGLEAD